MCVGYQLLAPPAGIAFFRALNALSTFHRQTTDYVSGCVRHHLIQADNHQRKRLGPQPAARRPYL